MFRWALRQTWSVRQRWFVWCAGSAGLKSQGAERQERVKHERELWKEVVERRQQQPLQLALSMKEPPGSTFLSELCVYILQMCFVGKLCLVVLVAAESIAGGGCFRGPLRPLLHSPQLEAKLPGLPAEASGAQFGPTEEVHDFAGAAKPA